MSSNSFLASILNPNTRDLNSRTSSLFCLHKHSESSRRTDAYSAPKPTGKSMADRNQVLNQKLRFLARRITLYKYTFMTRLQCYAKSQLERAFGTGKQNKVPLNRPSGAQNSKIVALTPVTPLKDITGLPSYDPNKKESWEDKPKLSKLPQMLLSPAFKSYSYYQQNSKQERVQPFLSSLSVFNTKLIDKKFQSQAFLKIKAWSRKVKSAHMIKQGLQQSLQLFKKTGYQGLKKVSDLKIKIELLEHFTKSLYQKQKKIIFEHLASYTKLEESQSKLTQAAFPVIQTPVASSDKTRREVLASDDRFRDSPIQQQVLKTNNERNPIESKSESRKGYGDIRMNSTKIKVNEIVFIKLTSNICNCGSQQESFFYRQGPLEADAVMRKLNHLRIEEQIHEVADISDISLFNFDCKVMENVLKKPEVASQTKPKHQIRLLEGDKNIASQVSNRNFVQEKPTVCQFQTSKSVNMARDHRPFASKRESKSPVFSKINIESRPKDQKIPYSSCIKAKCQIQSNHPLQNQVFNQNQHSKRESYQSCSRALFEQTPKYNIDVHIPIDEFRLDSQKTLESQKGLKTVKSSSSVKVLGKKKSYDSIFPIKKQSMQRKKFSVDYGLNSKKYSKSDLGFSNKKKTQNQKVLFASVGNSSKLETGQQKGTSKSKNSSIKLSTKKAFWCSEFELEPTQLKLGMYEQTPQEQDLKKINKGEKTRDGNKYAKNCHLTLQSQKSAQRVEVCKVDTEQLEMNSAHSDTGEFQSIKEWKSSQIQKGAQEKSDYRSKKLRSKLDKVQISTARKMKRQIEQIMGQRKKSAIGLAKF